MNGFRDFRRLGSFIAGGGMVALIGMCLLFVQVEYLGIHHQLAFAVQLVITLALNFTFNQMVTWRDVPSDATRQRAVRFLWTRASTLLFSLALFSVLTSDTIGLHYLAANVVCLVASTALNYYSSHNYVFTGSVSALPSATPPGPPAYVRTVIDSARQYTVASMVATFVVVLGIGYLTVGAYLTLVTLIVVTALCFGASASLEATWRLYGRRTPEAIEEMGFPAPSPLSGEDSFSLIVCAKDEPNVLYQTLMQLAGQTHPNVQIIASLIEGDHETIAEAEAAHEAFPDRIEVLVRSYIQNMKPHQLNAALPYCHGTYVGVIDAEDATAPELLLAVEAAFQTSQADVVQGGVQLMNLGHKLSEWFCVHNVLEYLFWFSSRMMFQAKHGFVPLGGNTVFIRRELLQRAGGWPISLTEDCALGVKLSTVYGAKVVAAYDLRLVTREETPDTIHNLLHQRIRWDAGFGKELLSKQWWQLPTLYQRILAWYILATPFIQAGAGILLPLTVVSVLTLDAPILLVLLTFIPYIPILLTLVLQVVGLREFGQMFNQKVRVRHYLFLILGFYPYQLVLSWAAILAVVRIATGNLGWWKTPHSNKHRLPVFNKPIEEVA